MNLGIFIYYHIHGDDRMGMSMNQRAAIFRPFNSLQGYQELLQEKEKIIVPERILSEDDLEILNRKIHRVQKGMIITIEYRENQEYIQQTGIVSKIDFQNGYIQIVKKRINLRNIVDIQADELEIYDY